MTDGQGPLGLKPDDSTENTVASLASQAIAVLASKRAGGRPPLSETLILDLVEAARGGSETAVDEAIAGLSRAGVPVEEIIDFYIPEAARRLGDVGTRRIATFTIYRGNAIDADNRAGSGRRKD